MTTAVTIWRPKKNQIYNMESLQYLRQCESGSVHCIITSPPYWGMRKYLEDGHPDQGKEIGLEPTIDEFIESLVVIFREARRVLHPTGTLWVNMGDCYASSANGRSASTTNELGTDDRIFQDKPFSTVGNGLKPKDLVGQPWRLALALQTDGWYLRNDIIWEKPSIRPESVTDRLTKSHEYVFMLAKSHKYYHDWVAISEPVKQESIARAKRGVSSSHKNMKIPGQSPHSMHRARANNEDYPTPTLRRKRTIWRVSSKGFKGMHYATFPQALISPMIEAGCPLRVCPDCGGPWQRTIKKEFTPQEDVSAERNVRNAPGHKRTYKGNNFDDATPRGTVRIVTTGWEPTCECDGNHEHIPGVVLDMFMGSGTTAIAAHKLGRDFMGCDLNPDYVKMASERLRQPLQRDMFISYGVDINVP